MGSPLSESGCRGVPSPLSLRMSGAARTGTSPVPTKVVSTQGESTMESRFYNSKDINIQQIAVDLVRAYQAMGYQAQNIGDKEQMIIQLKKGSEFEAIVGMQAALSVTLQQNANGTMVGIGRQKWIDKAAVGVASLVIPILWPLTFT